MAGEDKDMEGKKNLRELDAWIAEHGFGVDVAHDENRELYNKEAMVGGIIVGCILHYTKDAQDFFQVKREIEQRGWRWESSYLGTGIAGSGLSGKPHSFAILTDNGQVFCEVAETEELAGCLALKAAIEGEGR